MGEPKSFKRLKFWIFRVGIPVFIGALVLLYGWMAFGPTGYEDFGARHEGDLARVDQLLRESAPESGSDEPKAGAAEETSGTLVEQTKTRAAQSDASRGQLDFIATLRDYEKFIRTPDDPNLRYFAGRYRSGAGAVTGRQITFAPERFKTGRLFEEAAADPAIREEILSAAAGIKPHVRFLPEIDASDTTRALAGGSREALQRKLDEVEYFLLVEHWNIPDYAHFPGRVYESGLAQLTAMAIVRAELRGERAKAERLLERALEAMRVVHLSRFPVGEQFLYLNGTPSLLLAPMLATGDRGALSAGGYRRAEATLRRALITPEDLEPMARAVALKAVQNVKDAPFKLNDNGWHRFMGGVPESLVAGAMRPLAIRGVEKSAQDWASRERMQELDAMSLRMRGYTWQFNLCRCLVPMVAMNVELESIDPSIHEVVRMVPRDLMTGARGEVFNSGIHLMRLALATAAFRSERGYYPESVYDLVPGWPDQEYVDSPEIGWGVLRLGAGVEKGQDGRDGRDGQGGAPGATGVAAERPVFFHIEKGTSGGQALVFVSVVCPLQPLVDERVMEMLR